MFSYTLGLIAILIPVAPLLLWMEKKRLQNKKAIESQKIRLNYKAVRKESELEVPKRKVDLIYKNGERRSFILKGTYLYPGAYIRSLITGEVSFDRLTCETGAIIENDYHTMQDPGVHFNCMDMSTFTYVDDNDNIWVIRTEDIKEYVVSPVFKDGETIKITYTVLEKL